MYVGIIMLFKVNLYLKVIVLVIVIFKVVDFFLFWVVVSVIVLCKVFLEIVFRKVMIVLVWIKRKLF